MPERSVNVDIQSRDAALFRGLYESRVMTIDQIAALYFDGQREMTRKRITKLKQAGYMMYRAKDTALFTETIVTLDTAGYHHLLSEKLIDDLPRMTWPKLEKRLDVGTTVLKHELMVVDAKVAFCRGIGNGYRLAECATWPSLYAFDSVDSHGQAVSVYPDGFLRIEKADGDETFESCYFLEVDRSTERLEVLVERCVAYREYYRSGGFARWHGAKPDAYRDFYFRVLITCISAERRNNIAERLLMLPQPIRSQVWITTQNELMAEPFGPIWVRPKDYEATLHSPRSSIPWPMRGEHPARTIRHSSPAGCTSRAASARRDTPPADSPYGPHGRQGRGSRVPARLAPSIPHRCRYP